MGLDAIRRYLRWANPQWSEEQIGKQIVAFCHRDEHWPKDQFSPGNRMAKIAAEIEASRT